MQLVNALFALLVTSLLSTIASATPIEPRGKGKDKDAKHTTRTKTVFLYSVTPTATKVMTDVVKIQVDNVKTDSTTTFTTTYSTTSHHVTTRVFKKTSSSAVATQVFTAPNDKGRLLRAGEADKGKGKGDKGKKDDKGDKGKRND